MEQDYKSCSTNRCSTPSCSNTPAHKDSVSVVSDFSCDVVSDFLLPASDHRSMSNPTPSNMSICDAEIESDPYDLVDLRS